MDLCELDLLLAISFYRTGDKDAVLAALGRSLSLARRRGYYRLVADEGTAVMQMLVEYIKLKGESPFLKKLAVATRNMAARYPMYLMPLQKGGEELTEKEAEMLRFIAQGKSKEEIAEYFFLTVDGIKYHLKHIYKKLGAKNACQAVWEAQRFGIL